MTTSIGVDEAYVLDMTLLVGIAHPQYAVLLSDRLLTSFGASKPIAHSTKEGVLYTEDATVLYAYTGLAQSGAFDTARWLAETLQDAGKATPNLKSLLETAAIAAQHSFSDNTDVQRMNPADRRLLVMFVGFSMSGQIVYGQLANCIDRNTGKWTDEATDDFLWTLVTSTSMEKRPRLIQWQGTTRAILRSDFDGLDRLVGQGKPIRAVIGKAIDVMRKIADRPGSDDRIGKDILAGVLNAQTGEARSDFFPNGSSSSFYEIDRVNVLSTGSQVAISGAALTIRGKKVIDPRTPRQQPCPCGSGKRFRRCHGRKKTSGAA